MNAQKEIAAPRRPRRAQAGPAWAEVRVVTSPEGAEAVSAMLWDLGVAGVAEDLRSPTTVRVRGYLPPSRVGRHTLRWLRARVGDLAKCGLDPGPASVTSRPMATQRWARAWRGAARPLRLGRLIVVPTRVRVPARPGQIIIRIDPGMAFGSGAHPSTRLCLLALLRYFRAIRIRPFVADVGTGSGILAITAARLGARRVWARDVDPVAVAVARENLVRNGVAQVVRVARGAGLGPVPARYDLIVANIIAEAVADLLPEARRRLAPGGVFIGSGIVREGLDLVLNAGERAGLERIDVRVSGEWRAVVMAARGTFSPAPRQRV